MGRRAAAAMAPMWLPAWLPVVAVANLIPGTSRISNPNPLSGGTFSTEYTAEYFDVYSWPIRTRYSEVYWTMQDPIPLPDDIKKRFDNKTMAIVGYEIDQVANTSDGEVPVPITAAYNHHYMLWLNSKYSTMEQVDSHPHKMSSSCGVPGAKQWRATLKTPAPPDDEDIPISHLFSEGNGGEMRLSFHGYPKGYAQLIDSPTVVHLNPMQVDTKNRDHPGPGFVPGPLPRAATAPPNSSYSGLLECPCTTRIKKEWHMAYATQDQGTCAQPVQNATECFTATPTVVQAAHYTERSGADPTLPPGCTVEMGSDGVLDVFWNTRQDSQVACGGGGAAAGHVAAVVKSLVNITVALLAGNASDAVTITIAGPAGVWFGVGFGADSMCLHMVADECPSGGPYAIIVGGDGQQGVTERKLDDHGPGHVLKSSVVVTSSTVVAGVRTVVLTRALQGLTTDHYSFDPAQPSVQIINALGGALPFAQHASHAAAMLSFVAVDQRSCVCEAGIQGSIAGNPFPAVSNCLPEPAADLLQQRNPTCFVQTYSGGLRCCIHGQYLLDADQTVPDEYQEYQLKYRFYFEEYTPGPKPSHLNLVRLYYQTEANAGEYDIVPCLPGTAPQDCVQVITARWKVAAMMRDCAFRHGSDAECTGEGSSDPAKTAGVKLIYAGPHCHAPHCLSMELYNANTGQLLCHMEPIYGTSDAVYDERGYLALPPCLWGEPADGLMEPQLLSLDTELLSIKRNNNTWGHYGEMASWQMRGVVVPVEAPDVLVADTLPLPNRRWSTESFV